MLKTLRKNLNERKILGKTVEAYSIIGDFFIASGKVIDTAGANMLFIDIGSGEETAVTLSDAVQITIIE